MNNTRRIYYVFTGDVYCCKFYEFVILAGSSQFEILIVCIFYLYVKYKSIGDILPSHSLGLVLKNWIIM